MATFRAASRKIEIWTPSFASTAGACSLSIEAAAIPSGREHWKLSGVLLIRTSSRLPAFSKTNTSIRGLASCRTASTARAPAKRCAKRIPKNSGRRFKPLEESPAIGVVAVPAAVQIDATPAALHAGEHVSGAP